MKRLVLILAILAMATMVQAAPFLVCDPQSGVTSYKFTGPAWFPLTTAAQTDGSVRLDIVASPTGVTSITVAACKTDSVWGEVCSATVPFSFTRPSAPTSPSTIRLSN